MSNKESNGSVGAVGDDSIAARFIEDSVQERTKNKQEIQASGQVAVPGNPGMPNLNRDYGKGPGSKKKPSIEDALTSPIPGVRNYAKKISDNVNLKHNPTVKDRVEGELAQVTSVYTRQVVITIYHMLVAHAERGETIVYEQIAKACGLPTSGSQLGQVIAPLLSRIYDYCVGRNLPHLTSIVVRKSGNEKGLPGNGFWKLLGSEGIEMIGNIVVADSSGNPVELTNDSKRQITRMLQEEVYEHYSLKGI